MSGYTKSHRAGLDHPLFKGNVAYYGAWQWLINKAAWKPHKFVHRKKIVPLDRGQLPGARAHLATEWGWSEKAVRTFLSLLASDGMIEISQKTGQQITIITICNYNEYQSEGPVAGQQEASSGPARGHTEEVEEVKERSNRDANASLVADCDESEVGHDLLGDDLKPVKATRASLPIVESFNAYQETALRCGIAQARALTPAIRKSINARLKEYGPNGWADCLANIERSAFLCGHTEKSDFRVSLPWMLKPANFEKIVSGVYGNGRHAEKIPETDAASLYEKLIAGAQS